MEVKGGFLEVFPGSWALAMAAKMFTEARTWRIKVTCSVRSVGSRRSRRPTHERLDEAPNVNERQGIATILVVQ